MRAAVLTTVLAAAAFGQTFDVASVKASRSRIGPDANNVFRYDPAGISGRNVTLRRLIAEAYRLQLRQVLGPRWLDDNEYDLDAKAGRSAGAAEVALMLRALLAERFQLKQHRETREMRVYDLVVEPGGPKLPAAGGPGLHFQGDMRRFADLIGVQLSIAMPGDPTQPGRATVPVPVLDQTGLTDVYDFNVDVKPDGSDPLTLWQRELKKMALRLNSRRAPVEVLVVDSAAPTPTGN